MNIFKLSISKNKSLISSLSLTEEVHFRGPAHFYMETQSKCGSKDRETVIHVSSQDAAFTQVGFLSSHDFGVIADVFLNEVLSFSCFIAVELRYKRERSVRH